MQARWRSGTERRCCDRLSVPREIHPGVEECGPVNPSNLPLDRNPVRDRTQIVSAKGPSPCVQSVHRHRVPKPPEGVPHYAEHGRKEALGRQYHQLHVNLMYDLLEKRYSDVVIQPRAEIRETAAACDMVARSPLDRNCLYIFDRGYISLNLMAHIVDRNSFFLIRAKEINSAKSLFSRLRLPDAEEFDVPVRFVVTRNPKLWRKDPCLYKLIHNDRAFDFIDAGYLFSSPICYFERSEKSVPFCVDNTDFSAMNRLEMTGY